MAGQTGEKRELKVESLCSASRSCASPLLAWKHYVGSIIDGLQQRVRKLKINTAAGGVALGEV